MIKILCKSFKIKILLRGMVIFKKSAIDHSIRSFIAVTLSRNMLQYNNNLV